MKNIRQLKADLDLLRELEALSAGDLIHARLNLAGAYSSAIKQFNQTGDQDFYSIASDAHHALRIMLVRLRLRYAQ